jgi:large conductance mechanosensitive channel
LVQEFRDFIQRGNLVEFAVAFVMGIAFAAVIGSFVDRIVNPLIAMIFSLDGIDNIGTFGDGVGEDGVPLGSVGAFVGAVINFLIVGLVMFLVVKAYNKMQAAEEEEEAGPSEVDLLTEIRDNLTK